VCVCVVACSKADEERENEREKEKGRNRRGTETNGMERDGEMKEKKKEERERERETRIEKRVSLVGARRGLATVLSVIGCESDAAVNGTALVVGLSCLNRGEPRTRTHARTAGGEGREGGRNTARTSPRGLRALPPSPSPSAPNLVTHYPRRRVRHPGTNFKNAVSRSLRPTPESG